MANGKLTYWTAKDIETLHLLYGKMSNQKLAKLFGRSKQAIQHKAHKLSITTPKIAEWKYCIDCGCKLSRAAIYKDTAQRCRTCADNWHTAENHHNWKGGIASLRSIVHTMLKAVWIDPILRRDNYTCQFCQNRGGDMHVHHVFPYSHIRDQILKENPELSLKTFKGKKRIALKIVEAHRLSYGITLCVSCHALIHNEKPGELRETPNASGEGNPQPSRGNVIQFVPRKVQRLAGEDTQTNNPATSARHLHSQGMMR